MKILLLFFLLLAPQHLWGETFLPTRVKPVSIDIPGRRVLIYTEVNGKNVTESNRHWGIVAIQGTLADRGILRSWADPLTLHDALLKIGARPGNNLTRNNTGGFILGDRLEVTVSWPGLGRELPLQDIFEDSTGKGFNIRFGGNRLAAAHEGTGCITCLESCWVAITSNDRYPSISAFTRFISPNSHFRGKKNTLPGDGRPVIVTFHLPRQ